MVFRRNAGAHVAPADPGLFDQEMTVLAVLEGYATALTAETIDETGIARLEELNAAMAAAIERLDPLSFGRLNQEFHAVIHGHCANPTLVELLRDVARRLDAIRRTVFVQIPYRGVESIVEHRELIELLRRKAPSAEIEAAAREHKLHTVRSFRSWQAEHEHQLEGV